MHNKVLTFLFLLACTRAGAQTPIVPSDLSVPSKIAPAYFGPNAFPVPVIPEARLDKTPRTGAWTLRAVPPSTCVFRSGRTGPP